MCKSKKKKADVVFKIDLEKPYDYINLDLLEFPLKCIEFSPITINLILPCVTNSSMFIFWNERWLPNFIPTRGLRQGDPQVGIIYDILNRFTIFFCLKVNVAKSNVFLSAATKRSKMDLIVSSADINQTLTLEKYLGFPMLHYHLQRKDFEFLEDNIIQRLSSCQYNLLNKTGRLTLVTSIINSIPNYHMQVAWVP